MEHTQDILNALTNEQKARLLWLTALHAHIDDDRDITKERKALAKSAYTFLDDDALRTMYELLLKSKFRDALGDFVRDYVLEA